MTRGWISGISLLVFFLAPRSGAGGEPSPPPGASPDTTQAGYLERLQEEDREFYSDELWQTSPALRDSAVGELETLGLDRYRDLSDSRRSALTFDLVFADDLIAYNRVEGVVAGLGVDVEHRRGARLDLQAAYATAPRKLRHRESLGIPLGWRLAWLEAGYADRVVPYGSNRPTANTLRALVAAYDEQDYLRERNLWAALDVPWSRDHRFRLTYEAARQTSRPARADFSILGNGDRLGANPPVDEGFDRAVILEVHLGSLVEARQEATLRHRVSGGGLGGDFTYVRTDIAASARRYLPGNHEVTLDVGGARTGGSPPRQALADVGGLSTVRGYPRRSLEGRTSAFARMEVLSGRDLLGLTGLRALEKLRLQFLAWGDAGRVWEGNSRDWVVSLGAGVQRYIGPLGRGSFIRLDTAFPVGPDRPANTVWYLRFNRALF